MKKGLTTILGFAVGLGAVVFAQTIVQRPQYPSTGLSYVGYGDQWPTTALYGGELFIDVNGAGDSGQIFGMYDDVNAEWDRFLNASAAGVVNYLPKFEAGGTSLTDSQTIRSVGVPAANTDGSVIDIPVTINQFDAGNIVNVLHVDVDSPAAHLGAGFMNAIRVDNDANAAAGNDVGMVFNNQFDAEIHFEATQATIWWLETGSLLIQDFGGAIDFILTDMPDHGAADATVAALELDIVMDIMDAGDVQYGAFFDITNENHSGGTVIGVSADIDTPDAQAAETAYLAAGAWDYTLRQTGVAFAALPAAVVGAMVYCTDCDLASVPCASTPGPGAWAFGTSTGPRWECPW